MSDNTVADEQGEWHVEFGESIHGKEILRNRLDNGVMIMGLPRHHGWRAISPVRLPHQCKVSEVVEWLEEHSGAREVAIVDVYGGEWETVWSRDGHEPTPKNVP